MDDDRRNNNRHGHLLSNLSDAILILILSFLPSKDAVVTSVLSRRWRHLWKSVPRLDFDEHHFSDRNRFINFVETTTILRARIPIPLVSYSLSSQVLPIDASRISTWVTTAIWSRIKDLCLALDVEKSNQPYVLPAFIFMSKTLERLHLEMCYYYKLKLPASSIRLPNLKYLNLKYVEFDNDESAEKLLSCPSLEEVIIDTCFWSFIKNLTVFAPKLERLTIVDPEYPDTDNVSKIVIVGGNLKFLFHEGELINQYCLSGSNQLAEAIINTNIHLDNARNFELALNRGFILLTCLSTLQCLTINTTFIKPLKRKPELLDTIPVFNWMTKLELLGSSITINDMAVLKVLERCPHLETLNINGGVEFSNQGSDLVVPGCFKTHLKRVTIMSFGLLETENKAVEYLLNSGAVLEEMVVHYRHEMCQIIMVRGYLDSLQRASENCRISVFLAEDEEEGDNI